MTQFDPVIRKIIIVTLVLVGVLILAMLLGLSMGSAGGEFITVLKTLSGRELPDSLMSSIVWKLRFPRVLLAALVGAALSLGGLVFQALLRNPLAEPYILGISGGAAIGAIVGILMGLSRFPGVSLSAFGGSLLTLFLILTIASGRAFTDSNRLLLSGVMVNSFCSAVIMFLVSMTQDSRLHNILFWLMGDMTAADSALTLWLGAALLPGFLVVFLLAHSMNLMLMGKEMAQSMGVNTRVVTGILLVVTTFSVGITVSVSGLVGFVGLVTPHLLRMALGPDHRILVPACIFGGGAFVVFCDLAARVLPEHGEMPTGVITALVGAPLFIYLLRRTRS